MSSRVLIGVTESSAPENVSSILSWTGVDLLVSRLLPVLGTDVADYAQAVQYMYASHSQTELAWSLVQWSPDMQADGDSLMKSLQLLLMTLPGTPVFTYGNQFCQSTEVSSADGECDGTKSHGGIMVHSYLPLSFFVFLSTFIKDDSQEDPGYWQRDE